MTDVSDFVNVQASSPKLDWNTVVGGHAIHLRESCYLPAHPTQMQCRFSSMKCRNWRYLAKPLTVLLQFIAGKSSSAKQNTH